jgi:hypothetical protein
MTLLSVKAVELRTASYRSGEDYGDWSESNDFDLGTGVAIEKGDGRDHRREYFKVGFDAKCGDLVHLVVLRYSSGDSFGSASGLGEVLWIFKDSELAYKALRQVEQKNDEATSYEFETEGGTKKSVGNPVYDYFSNVQDVDVVTLPIVRIVEDN